MVDIIREEDNFICSRPSAASIRLRNVWSCFFLLAHSKRNRMLLIYWSRNKQNFTWGSFSIIDRVVGFEFSQFNVRETKSFSSAWWIENIVPAPQDRLSLSCFSFVRHQRSPKNESPCAREPRKYRSTSVIIASAFVRTYNLLLERCERW